MQLSSLSLLNVVGLLEPPSQIANMSDSLFAVLTSVFLERIASLRSSHDDDRSLLRVSSTLSVEDLEEHEQLLRRIIGLRGPNTDLKHNTCNKKSLWPLLFTALTSPPTSSYPSCQPRDNAIHGHDGRQTRSELSGVFSNCL